MAAINTDNLVTIGLIVGVGVLAMKVMRDGWGGLTAGAVDAIDDAAGGVVQGLGAVVGLPMTNRTECDKARAEGRYMDASLYCPANEFLSYGSGQVVQDIGAVIGVPRTNETDCERAKREGRTLDASFYCPAGDWLKYVFN